MPTLCAEDTPFPFSGNDTFEGVIPAPGDWYGIPLGERFTPHHDVMAYCREVAKLSDRVHFQEYGRSTEGRELVLLMISTEANIARLEEIRAAQALLADPRRMKEREDLDLDQLLEDLPAVIWLSYNVHGDESSATEAALATIHQLADGSDEKIRAIRENCLVIIDPLLNPDGRERYLQWYHQVQAHPANPDPAAAEHDPPSPSGRSNHYLFDLNRDWAWQSQVETRARIEQYLQWQPLVHVDFHEMSAESTYFFFPPEKPINANIPEDRVQWSETFGLSNAGAFDRFGWKYYTAEQFDLFYPAYGDSWPTLNGSIGMTYEQAGGGRAGLAYRRRNGTILTLVDRLHHHHVAGLATADCAARHRVQL
ncbi:MAG: M14 metallopeptidase family protein, partial [Planctomycetota bacterium]